MLYGAVVEDGYLLRAVPVLVKRMVSVGQAEVECRVWNGKPDFMANFWRSVKEFQFKYPKMHKAIGVCDADQESPEELEARLTESAGRRLRNVPFPLMFHVIKRELETWWIVDPDSVSRATGVNIQFPGGNVEAAVLHPKEYLVRGLSQGEVPYTKSIAESLAQNLNFETVESRCPGFVAFKVKVENGGKAGSEAGQRVRRIKLLEE